MRLHGFALYLSKNCLISFDRRLKKQDDSVCDQVFGSPGIVPAGNWAA